MKQLDKIKSIESRYKIQGLHIIDTKKEIKNGDPIYIREILDSGSHEYTSSTISKKDRWDIVGSLGTELLTATLKDCFKNNGVSYDNVENEVAILIMHLLKAVYPSLGFCLVENNSNLEIVLQLASPRCKYKGTPLPHEHPSA